MNNSKNYHGEALYCAPLDWKKNYSETENNETTEKKTESNEKKKKRGQKEKKKKETPRIWKEIK